MHDVNNPGSRATDAVRREYDAMAGGYDDRWGAYTRVTVEQTLQRVCTRVRAGDHVLDVGCGTGALLDALAAKRSDLVLSGVDHSPGMLASAQAKLGDRAALREASAEKLPFADASFDLVVSSSVLHFVSNPQAALREWCRVLRAEEQLVVTDWRGEALIARLRDGWLRVTGRRHGRALQSAALQSMAEEAGFRDVLMERFRAGLRWPMVVLTATRCSGAARDASQH